MLARAMLTTLALAVSASGAPRDEAPSEPVITMCQVASIEAQDVPGADQGMLAKLNVKEGDRVTKDMEIARIDDREAQALATVKELDYKSAQQEADSDIVIKLAKETSNVAKAGYDKLVAANKESDRTVTQIEILRALLEYKKAELQREKAEEDNLVAKMTAKAKKAEADAAKVTVERRVLRAPFDGVVEHVYRHIGEWVAPGDPVVQIVRVDRLRVSGTVDASKWGPADLEGRKVTVEVALPRGRTEKVPGKIVFVSPVVALGHEIPVWAEIDSPIEDGRPLVRAGLNATMTIHSNQLAETEPPRAPAPATRKATARK